MTPRNNLGTVPIPLLRANILKMTPPPFIGRASFDITVSSKPLELQTSLGTQNVQNGHVWGGYNICNLIFYEKMAKYHYDNLIATLQLSLEQKFLYLKQYIKEEKSFSNWVFATIISLAFTVLATLDPSYPATTPILASTLATRAWIR